MDESDWMAGRSGTMIQLLPAPVQRLLASEYARLCLPIYEAAYPRDLRPSRAVEWSRHYSFTGGGDVPPRSAAEIARSAAWSAAESAWSAAWSAAGSAESAAWSARSVAWCAAESAGSAAWCAAESAARSARSAAESAGSAAGSAAWSAARSAQYRIYARALGVGLVWSDRWRTSTVVAIANTIVDGVSLDLMPVLMDALLDAGCDLDLAYLQTQPAELTLADWTITSAVGLWDSESRRTSGACVSKYGLCE